MKKTLIFTNLISLILLIYVYYRSSSFVDKNVKECKQSCYNYENEPIDEIPYEAMNTVMDNYRDRWGSKFDKKDTRWVWFPIEKIKHFVYLIEQTKCTNCLPKSTLGIRFYFIEYPDKLQLDGMDDPSKNYFSNLSSNYYRKHNLLLVPTYENNEKKHIDFDIKSSKLNCKYITMNDVIERNKKGKKEKISFYMFSAAPGDATNPFAMNRGGMGPPPYNEGDNLMSTTDNQ